MTGQTICLIYVLINKCFLIISNLVLREDPVTISSVGKAVKTYPAFNEIFYHSTSWLHLKWHSSCCSKTNLLPPAHRELPRGERDNLHGQDFYGSDTFGSKRFNRLPTKSIYDTRSFYCGEACTNWDMRSNTKNDWSRRYFLIATPQVPRNIVTPAKQL